MRRIAAALAIIAFSLVAAQDQRSWAAPQELCSIKDKRINESSGLAASRITPGVFYTHNDSGDKARFFRFNRNGKVTGTFVLNSIDAYDWEDMCSAVINNRAFLYLADIGDNGSVRKSIKVHRVQEPKSNGEQDISRIQSYTLTYPDGAHDCEAILVQQNGDITLITKAWKGETQVYKLKNPMQSGTYKLKHVAEIKVNTGGYGGRLVTGADLSPDGKHIVIRTYSGALEYAVPANFDDWTKSEPTSIRLPIEIQGEAICYSKDGKYILTSSERSPCPVSILSLKTGS